MTTRRKLLTVIGVLVGLPILYMGSFHGYQLIRAHQAGGKVEAARQHDKPLNAAYMALQTKNLADSGVVAKRIASSVIDTCYIGGVGGGGWTGGSWQQVCYLRYVQGYETTLSIEEARGAMYNPALKLPGSPPDNVSQSADPCLLIDSRDGFSSDETLVYIPANNPPSNDPHCDIPSQKFAGLSRSFEPAAANTDTSPMARSVKYIQGFDAGKLDKSANQIWLSYDSYYYREGLGCVPFSLFCDSSPRSTPAGSP